MIRSITLLSTAGAGLMLSANAYAFECSVFTSCSDCAWHVGSSVDYFINTNEFTTAEEDDIEDGADAWTAGAGKILRGAGWEFIRNDTNVDGTIGNGDNNVRRKGDTWFTNRGLPTTTLAAESTVTSGCDIGESDITYRSTLTYSTGIPSDDPANTSVGMIASTPVAKRPPHMALAELSVILAPHEG